MASMSGNVDETRNVVVSVENTPGRRNQAVSVAANKESKKKRKNTNKEKPKAQSEVKKRGHPRTPSNSDDSEKPQTEQWTSTERNTEQKPPKGHVKERGPRKCRKSKTTQPVAEEAPTQAEEEKLDNIIPLQDSMRWEGVLDDPVAEAERLEIYKANRRERYIAFRQTVVKNIQLELGSGSNAPKMGLSYRHRAAANIL